MKTRVKICGIRRLEDALIAAGQGADAIGLVFYEPSPRAVDIDTARVIANQVPAFVTVVGLFVNPTVQQVEDVLAKVPLDLLQFHGDESPDFCQQFGRRWIKAIRVQGQEDIEEAFECYHQSSGLLVDAYDPRQYGGTGKSFDWRKIPDDRPLPLILAGGLNSGNVARAVTEVKPWAVDVSGGVESRKGVKDAARIIEFLNEVHRVNKTD